jgi:3-hydroxybutyryl-CoA dehydrogenase
MSKQVIIAGEAPYVEILRDLCTEKGFKVDVHRIDELDEQENLDKLVDDAAKADIFIESLNESVASKMWLVEGVEINLKDQAPILTNALCASATEVASWCENPRRVIGIGVLPPFKTPGKIEFAPALQTDVPNATAAREFLEKAGFEIVRVPDTPGLVRGRLLMTLINEAAFVLNEKLASAEDIDKALQQACKLPRGPLAWADEIGLDVVLGSLLGMYDFWGEERYRPAPLLKQKVRAGHLGKRSGQGFFVDPLVVQPQI